MNAGAGRLDSACTITNSGSWIHKHDGSTLDFGLELGRFFEALVVGMACIQGRRPRTTQDVSGGLGIPTAETAKRLEILERDGEIVIRRRAGEVFRSPLQPKKDSREHR